MARRRGGRSQVDWMPSVLLGANVANLAGGAEATIINGPIDHAVSGEDYSSGALVGLRLWLYVNPEAAVVVPPRFVMMILPSSMSVPPVGTAGEMKAQEKFIWFTFRLRPFGPPAATGLFGTPDEGLHIKTVRRFDQGDLIVGVIHNADPAVAWGAGAQEIVDLDLYVRED